MQKKNGKSYYYVKTAGSGEYKYIGKENKLVMRVKEAAHLEKASEVIKNDLELIEALIDGYVPYDNNAVSKMLPNAYRVPGYRVINYSDCGSDDLEFL